MKKFLVRLSLFRGCRYIECRYRSLYRISVLINWITLRKRKKIKKFECKHEYNERIPSSIVVISKLSLYRMSVYRNLLYEMSLHRISTLFVFE